MSSPEPDDPFTGTDRAERLQRLGAAMAAFLQFRAGQGSADRAAFLAEHAELRDLLEPMFEAPGGGDAAAHGDAESGPVAPGRCLGDYRLLREVGRGGMGVVFEAEQISLRRRVALKVLPAHLTSSVRSIERFRREAAAASRLRHPAIVPIHEVGEWQGVHFYSMEFVEGCPLVAAMQHDRLGVRDDCSRVAEAAELVAQLGDALQHAHDHGLVHRDVKPHNVMIGAGGSVRLLDFGLAKEVGAPTHSATGEFLGTPHYCSPEQVTGQAVGPASDVFSLGIVLYELLARRRPFEADSARLVLRRIEAGEFPSLRIVAPTVPRDLQTICHKALERRPQDRYPSAGAFAADLRRFLRIEPIHALAPGPLTRSVKWLRRHRLGAALLGATALTLVGAPIGYALHLQRTHVAVERERVRLDQAEEIGFTSIEQTLTLLGEQLDRQPSVGAQQAARLDETVGLCEQFLHLRADAPRRRARLAHALYTIGGIYAHLGRLDEAAAACVRSRQLLEESPGLDAVQAALRLGLVLQRELHVRQLADPVGGEAEFERALAHWRPLILAADAAPALVAAYADTLLVRGRALADLPDKKPEAERLLRDALGRVTAPKLQQEATARRVVWQCEATLGQVLLGNGRTAEALELLERAVARIDQQPASPERTVEKAIASVGIGNAQQRLGRSEAAEASLRAAAAECREQLGAYPGSQRLRRALLTSSVLLGSQLITQGKYDDGEQVLRAAAGEVEPGVADRRGGTSWMDRSLLADLDVQLANAILIRHGAGEASAEAERLLLEACRVLEALADEQPDKIDHRLDLGVAWNSLASLANERGDASAAVTFAERAIAAQRRVLAVMPEHRRARTFLGVHQAHLAYALVRVGRPDAAVAAATEAMQYAPRHPATMRLAAEAAARAALAVAADESLAPAERAQRAAAHGGVAVAALARIGEVDQREARRLLDDARFAGLRERADFRQLQASIPSR